MEKQVNEASLSEGINFDLQNIASKEAWGEKNTAPAANEVVSKVQRTSRRRKPWVEALTAFADDVSVVGLRYVANPFASLIRRSIWLVLILVGAGFTIYQIENRIRRYASHPVNVNIRVEHKEEMRFPTVTICNENRVFYAKVAALG